LKDLFSLINTQYYKKIQPNKVTAKSQE